MTANRLMPPRSSSSTTHDRREAQHSDRDPRPPDRGARGSGAPARREGRARTAHRAALGASWRPGGRRRPRLPGPRRARGSEAREARHQGSAEGDRWASRRSTRSSTRSRNSAAGGACRAATRAPGRVPAPGSKWPRSATCSGGCDETPSSATTAATRSEGPAGLPRCLTRRRARPQRSRAVRRSGVHRH